MFSTQEVLKVTRQAEEESLRTRSKKSIRQALIYVQIPKIEENILNYIYIESNSDSDSSIEVVDK